MALVGPHGAAVPGALRFLFYGLGSSPPTMLRVPSLPIGAESPLLMAGGVRGQAIVEIPSCYLEFLGAWLGQSQPDRFCFLGSLIAWCALLFGWGDLSPCTVRRLWVLSILFPYQLCVASYWNWSGVARRHLFCPPGSPSPGSI